MSKSVSMGAVVATWAISAGMMAGYLASKDPVYAEVVSVDPVRQSWMTPENENTRDNAPERRASAANPAANDPSLRCTPIGGMPGAVMPLPMRKITPVEAAAADAPAAAVHRNILAGPSFRVAPDPGCEALLAVKVVAYDVRYRLRGRTAKVRMGHDPGERLLVRHGKVVLSQRDAPALAGN